MLQKDKIGCMRRTPYRTQGDASQAVKGLQWAGRRGAPVIYQCEVCGKWHIEWTVDHAGEKTWRR